MSAQVLLFGRLSAQAPADFDAHFWAVWPRARRVGRMQAVAEWRRLSPAERERCRQALPAHVAHWQAEGTEPRHIPHPHRWIRNRRFDDELPDVPGVLADHAAQRITDLCRSR